MVPPAVRPFSLRLQSPVEVSGGRRVSDTAPSIFSEGARPDDQQVRRGRRRRGGGLDDACRMCDSTGSMRSTSVALLPPAGTRKDAPQEASSLDGCARASAASGSHCRHAAGIVGPATWMKMCGSGRGGGDACPPCRAGCRPCGGCRARTTRRCSPTSTPALGPRDHVVDREVRARAAVLARPAVAGEDRAARDLAAVRVARDLDVADEPDDHRPRHRGARSAAPRWRARAARPSP